MGANEALHGSTLAPFSEYDEWRFRFLSSSFFWLPIFVLLSKESEERYFIFFFLLHFLPLILCFFAFSLSCLLLFFTSPISLCFLRGSFLQFSYGKMSFFILLFFHHILYFSLHATLIWGNFLLHLLVILLFFFLGVINLFISIIIFVCRHNNNWSQVVKGTRVRERVYIPD